MKLIQVMSTRPDAMVFWATTGLTLMLWLIVPGA